MDEVKLPFADRREAGRALAGALRDYAGGDVLVLALPRGGVPVGHEVAQALSAPLDVLTVRKIGTPGHRELAAGAVASGGIRVLDEELIERLAIARSDVEAILREELRELERRERLYRRGRTRPSAAGRVVILVDDGIATGNTMRAAVLAVRQLVPAKVVVAVPVAPAETVQMLSREADEVCCLASPSPFWAVGQWYERFDQVSDEAVSRLLADAAAGREDE